ncbi:MAG: DUF362 domain-containing protein [Candidatus Saganbacteria bacterium]|nr:DUF362 domain-containing protein [Candidatus Saganbacteria bacterium]
MSTTIFAGRIKAGDPAAKLNATLRRGLSGCGLNLTALKDKRVLITPNLCGPGSQEHRFSMTSPDLISSLIDLAYAGGASEVAIAGHPANYVRDRRAFFHSLGVTFDRSLMYWLGPRFLDVKEASFSEVEGLQLSELPKSYDVILNAALPKTHHQADGFTGVCKNLAMGLLGNRHEIHKGKRLAEAISTANRLVRQGRLVIDILDGRFGQDGLGPHFGTPREPGFMVIGTDGAAVDSYGMQLVGLDPHYVTYLQGAGRVNDFNVRGDFFASSLPLIRFQPSPGWSFAPLEGGKEMIVFWLDEAGIGHLRHYAYGAGTNHYGLGRSWRVKFFNNQVITSERAERWGFTEGNFQSVLASPPGTYHAGSPVELTFTDEYPQPVGRLRKWFGPNFIEVAERLSRLAADGDLSLLPGVPGRDSPGELRVIQGSKEVEFEKFDGQRGPGIPYSEQQSALLRRVGIKQVLVHRGASAEEIMAGLKPGLYRQP